MDPWSTLFASLALLYVVRGDGRRYLTWTAVGIATKGWPVVFAMRDWIRGQRRRAVVLVGATAVLAVVLLLTPGFRSGRSFSGVHLETLTGSITLLFRLVADKAHGIESAAGALYISAGIWAVIANLLIGVTVWTVSYLRRSGRSDIWLAAVAVTGLLLASPLLSAQFLLWLTPFVALLPHRQPQWLLFLAGTISTILLLWWDPDHVAWALLLVTRNVVLVAGAVALITAHPVSSAEAL